MKVLTNAAEARALAEGGERTPVTTPAPGTFAAADHGHSDPLLAGPAGRRARRAPRAPRADCVPRRPPPLGGARRPRARGASGAVAYHFGAPWLRPGVVVVTSEPQGLEVLLDGQHTGTAHPGDARGRAPRVRTPSPSGAPR